MEIKQNQSFSLINRSEFQTWKGLEEVLKEKRRKKREEKEHHQKKQGIRTFENCGAEGLRDKESPAVKIYTMSNEQS